MVDDRACEFHRSIDPEMLAGLGEPNFSPAGGAQESVGNRIFVESVHAVKRT